jgi:hypothetical protein
MDQKPQPIDVWCGEHCPDLGKRFVAIVAEWNLSEADKDACVVLLLKTVKENVK